MLRILSTLVNIYKTRQLNLGRSIRRKYLSFQPNIPTFQPISPWKVWHILHERLISYGFPKQGAPSCKCNGRPRHTWWVRRTGASSNTRVSRLLKTSDSHPPLVSALTRARVLRSADGEQKKAEATTPESGEVGSSTAACLSTLDLWPFPRCVTRETFYQQSVRGRGRGTGRSPQDKTVTVNPGLSSWLLL